MTKKEYRQHKADWAAALKDGRVVRLDRDGYRMKSYPTIAMRDAEIASLIAAEAFVEIVRVDYGVTSQHATVARHRLHDAFEESPRSALERAKGRS